VTARGRNVFGIDMGGTNLRVALGSPAGELLDKRFRATQAEPGAEAGIKALTEMMEELAAANNLRMSDIGATGVGVPGPSNPATGVLLNPPHLPGWHNFPVAGRLEAATGIPTRLENDAQLAAYGEFHRGAGRGTRHLLYVTISTGIGGGIVIDGKLYIGAGGTAGEVGHIVIDPDGPICGCGRRGHLEAVASGTAMARIAAERIAAGETSSLSRLEKITAKAIGDAADAGDALAQAVLRDSGRLLGLGLGGLLNILDPEVLVLGGGVIMIGPAFLDHVHPAIKESAFESTYSHVRIVTVELGQDAGLVGALEFALDLLPGGRDGLGAAT
jgi:glucokinase